MKLMLSVLFFLIGHLTYADNTITGKLKVVPGEEQTYTVEWTTWDNMYENYANVSWQVTNGTVIESDKHTVTIKWNETPQWLNENGVIEVSEDLGGGSGMLTIEIFNFVTGITETCSGILGTPVVYQDFGAGPNPGPPMPAGTISYQYQNYCAIVPGEYTRVNSTVNCRSSWYGIPQDHTPNDVNGYMLMIDGDTQRGEIFRTTVSGNLTTAFKYEFSAWVASLTDIGEDPRIHFELWDLNGNLIRQSGIYQIAFNPTNLWQRVSVMFDLPVGTTSVTVIMVNNNNDYSGNDFVVDDLSFAPCYTPIIASFSATDIIDRSSICNSGSINLYSRWPTPTLPFANPSYKWQRSVDNGNTWVDIPGATTANSSISENFPGMYRYRIYAYETTNPTQFVISNELKYFVQKMKVEPLTYNVYNCNTSPVQLYPIYTLEHADPEGPPLSFTFTWSPATYLSNPNIERPFISLPPLAPPLDNVAPPPPVSYTYNLSMQNTQYGCIGSSTQTVLQYNPRKVLVPSAFTPNGDGSNDLFRPLNLQDYPGGKFWVYNRWGQTIFYSEGPTLIDFSWNGTYQGLPQEIGNYPWRVHIPGCPTNILNGVTGTTNSYGNVVLIR